MSGNERYFVEWKEQHVSQERGNRVVHYFLKDSAGECVLAVIGTERSLRHMSYVVAEEFLQMRGSTISIRAGFKWRSRREVVDWLTSMLSKQNHLDDRQKSPVEDSMQGSKSSGNPVKCIGAMEPQVAENLGYARNLKNRNSDIGWLGVSWTCGKRLKHFPAFCRNGTNIAVQSFVFVMAKGETHYVAYLEDMYEDKKGQKKVKVRWFHRSQEVRGAIPLRDCHPKEVFITPYAQVISAECVDGPTTVLTPEHYKKCSGAFPNAIVTKMHLCSRQFKNNKVKPFNLSKLRGYFDQLVLSYLANNALPRSDSTCNGISGEKDEEMSSGDIIKLGVKRSRNGDGLQFLADQLGISSLNLADCQPSYPVEFRINEKIEVLCQDSGIRGCWFRGTILQLSRKHIKVSYDDLQDEDGCGNLKELVPATRLALPDKLGMRCLGRPTIRPAPPPSSQTDLVIGVGVAVDAWWSDGWWEGILIGLSNCGDDTFQIYFPGEKQLLNIHKKDLRMSRDWTRGQWTDIKPKPDILSVISVNISPEVKQSASSTIPKHEKSDGVTPSNMEVDGVTPSNMEVSTDSEPRTIQVGKPDCVASGNGDGLPENKEAIECMKMDECTEGAGNNVNDRQNIVDDVQVDSDRLDKDDRSDDNIGKMEEEVVETK